MFTRAQSWPLVAAATALGAYGVLQWLGRTYGTTRHDRRLSLPGDEIVPKPRFIANHAVTIDAPPEAVWPWLVQMGWHRAGWYTAHWVDRLLFPANRPSSDRIIDDLQQLEIGDFIPDGTPESQCGFIVEQLAPNRHLVLHSTTHLPLQWRIEGKAAVNWSWAFVLLPTQAPQTRLVFRWRATARPWWLVTALHASIMPADFVMSRDMLRGIKSRIEATQRERDGALQPCQT